MLTIYEQVREVPKEAQKPFDNGRFKGTDINPMWRIKKLTELFGPCGIGWYYERLDKWSETLSSGEVCVFVEIALYVKHEGEWSKPIYGTGGSQLLQMTKKGPYANDEAYKMATTDAISVACKNLGMGADIYWQNDNTKYVDEKKPAPAVTEQDRPGLVEKVSNLIGDLNLSTEKVYAKAGVTNLNEIATNRLPGMISWLEELDMKKRKELM